MTSSEAVRYTANQMERLHSSTVPTSDTAATATVLDGFTTVQTDHHGGSWCCTRHYLSTGMLRTATDSRGISTSTQPDLAGRTIIQTDGAGHDTTSCCDQPASITANPLQWSSEIADDELDLTYYNYRHYNPADGRWINRDPIGILGGLNVNGFVGNSIIRNIDTLGLDSGLLYRTPDCFYRKKCKQVYYWECQCNRGYRHQAYGYLPFEATTSAPAPPPYHNTPLCFCDPELNPLCKRNPQFNNQGDPISAEEIAMLIALGLLTVGAAISPFDGPFGEIAAGGALIARASAMAPRLANTARMVAPTVNRTIGSASTTVSNAIRSATATVRSAVGSAATTVSGWASSAWSYVF